ncbi:hypothetical protein BLX24_13365 [Arsenicibacter rosenii]|uniref:Uncharacterized protein n=1 Tax=Arsenicibacter rosenii TaxID=1750698 RepID=A0A1S2VL87_9BACT|nr:hypothetical protein BLX24_13365 [Arsenicibacter rosenii]
MRPSWPPPKMPIVGVTGLTKIDMHRKNTQDKPLYRYSMETQGERKGADYHRATSENIVFIFFVV